MWGRAEAVRPGARGCQGGGSGRLGRSPRDREGASLRSGCSTWAHAPLPRSKGGALDETLPNPRESVVFLFPCFFFWTKEEEGRRCPGPQNRALVRRGTALVASNLIGRLAEATKPGGLDSRAKARTRAGWCGPSEGLSRHLHFPFAPFLPSPLPGAVSPKPWRPGRVLERRAGRREERPRWRGGGGNSLHRAYLGLGAPGCRRNSTGRPRSRG